jgi:hypothetical protein
MFQMLILFAVFTAINISIISIILNIILQGFKKHFDNQI